VFVQQRWRVRCGMALAVLLSALAVASGNAKNVKTIGILPMTPVLDSSVKAFKKRLTELGYREGETIHYVYRNAQGSVPNPARLCG